LVYSVDREDVSLSLRLESIGRIRLEVPASLLGWDGMASV
jgi:hypothetical protein